MIKILRSLLTLPAREKRWMPAAGSVFQRLLVKPELCSTEDRNYIYFLAYKFGALIQLISICLGIFLYKDGILLNYIIGDAAPTSGPHVWADFLRHMLSIMLYWPCLFFLTIIAPIIILIFHLNVGFPDPALHNNVHAMHLEKRQSLVWLLAAAAAILLTLFLCVPWLFLFLQNRLSLLDSATYVILIALPLTVWIILGSYYALTVILIDVLNLRRT